MEKRINSEQGFSVGELARMAHVSVRTLHHYDAIGLLKPATVAANGYRVYGRAEALRLQEILFYRAVGLSLDEISGLLSGPQDRVKRLRRHRQVLADKARAAQAMLITLDRTIASLEGETDMAIEDLYIPFSPDIQAGYEDWLVEQYGETMVGAIAQAKDKGVNPLQGGGEELARLRDVETELVAAYQSGLAPDDKVNHPVLEQHRAVISRFWGRECDADGVEGLAKMYESHADFIARYETLAEGFSAWLPNAMRAHAGRLRQG